MEAIKTKQKNYTNSYKKIKNLMRRMYLTIWPEEYSLYRRKYQILRKELIEDIAHEWMSQGVSWGESYTLANTDIEELEKSVVAKIKGGNQ